MHHRLLQQILAQGCVRRKTADHLCQGLAHRFSLGWRSRKPLSMFGTHLTFRKMLAEEARAEAEKLRPAGGVSSCSARWLPCASARISASARYNAPKHPMPAIGGSTGNDPGDSPGDVESAPPLGTLFADL